MKATLKTTHPLCFAVAYREARFFGYHAFKVKEDRELLLGMIEKNDKKNLDFMEGFYKLLIKDQTCNKDIFARNSYKLVPLSDAED